MIGKFILVMVCLGVITIGAMALIIDDELITDTVTVTEDKFTIPRNDDWMCGEYSMAFQKENPEWGFLIITQPDNPRFQGHDIGDNHIVNYIINDDKSITIHDEQMMAEYKQSGWINEPDNWHFVIGEPVKTWDELRDNKEEIWDALA